MAFVTGIIFFTNIYFIVVHIHRCAQWNHRTTLSTHRIYFCC